MSLYDFIEHLNDKYLINILVLNNSSKNIKNDKIQFNYILNDYHDIYKKNKKDEYKFQKELEKIKNSKPSLITLKNIISMEYYQKEVKKTMKIDKNIKINNEKLFLFLYRIFNYLNHPYSNKQFINNSIFSINMSNAPIFTTIMLFFFKLSINISYNQAKTSHLNNSSFPE